jgi:rod shape-determining protein MreD
MRRVFGVLLMLAAVLVQVTWASRIEIAGAFPNFVLLAVVGLTWTSGVGTALVWACVGGIMLDLTSPGPIGPHAVALLVGVYVTGFWVRNLDRDSPVHPALAAALSTALYSLVLVEADDLLGLPMPPFKLAAQLTIAACLYNGLLMPLALVAMRKVQGEVRSRGPVTA